MTFDPMLRGNAAPAGFASSVSGWIQSYVAQERLRNPSATMNVNARLNTIDGCSSAPVAAGDDDPRIRTLALASPGPRWNPGAQQTAVLHGAGHKPGSLSGEPNDGLTGDKLLDALAHGAMLDMQAAHQTELATVRKGPEAAPLQTALLAEERERADRAERRNRELSIEVATASEHYQEQRTLRRQYQAILQSTGQLPNGNGESPKGEPIPAGVRKRGQDKHGQDRFEALLYRTESINGKQRGVGTFASVDEAVEARRAAVKSDAEAKALRDKRGPEMPAVSAAGGYDQMSPAQAAIVEAEALTS